MVCSDVCGVVSDLSYSGEKIIARFICLKDAPSVTPNLNH